MYYIYEPQKLIELLTIEYTGSWQNPEWFIELHACLFVGCIYAAIDFDKLKMMFNLSKFYVLNSSAKA